ncbi:MAG: metallophosphoesterase [Planctomycetes bacterium]|nr:metallophosphoesterase [Planctomycetota bacterium]
MEGVFRAIGITVTLLNVVVLLALWRRIRVAFPKHGRLVCALVAVPYALLLHPALLLAVGPFSGMYSYRHQAPMWVQVPAMAFQFAVWAYGALLLAWGTPAAIADAVRKLRALLRGTPAAAPEADLANADRRRAMAKAALAAPAAIVAFATGGALASRATPVVRHLRLPVPRNLTVLHGLTIAQVSDVHVGSYMDRARLREILDVINAVGADFHVVTGDLLDNHVNQLEDACWFLRSLQPQRETFMCMGNHEYIAARTADEAAIVAGLRSTPAALLIDEARKVQVGGAHFWMGGIDYPPQRGLEKSVARNSDVSLQAALGAMADDGAPRIVLSHHPAAFHAGRDMALDLMLSGHTHGGQIVAGRLGDWALSPVLPFEFYHNGYYEHEGRRLYVNSGAGGWMPVRINCPPEITVVHFT